MKIKEKIDHNAFIETHREFDTMQDLVNAIRTNAVIWSWGAHAWTKMNDFCLRFKVQGHHHNGHVYIVVNGADLFDVYLTTSRGTIKNIFTDIFVDCLIDTIDNAVERIPSYVD